MDTVDVATRSRIMAAVGQRNTAPEVALRKALHASGIRYSLHRRDLPGSPDIVCARHRAVIFVHGCFWHGHGCRLSKIPANRADFWAKKFSDNRLRDQRIEATLIAQGWRVAVVWQCVLNARMITKIAGRLEKWLRGQRKKLNCGTHRQCVTTKM